MDIKAGRGIIILAHSSIQHLVVDAKNSMNQGKFEEACIIEIRLSDNNLMTFACIYRSVPL